MGVFLFWSSTFATQNRSPAGGRLNASGETRKGFPLTLPLPCDMRGCEQQNLRVITERNTIRQDGVSQRVDKPTPLSFRGAKRRGNPYLFRQKPAKSAEFVRFRNGLPRQCAHWLAMTGFFDRLTPSVRMVFLFGAAILLRKIGRLRAGDRTRAGNSGAFPPFILTVDRLGWVCYLLTAIHSH